MDLLKDSGVTWVKVGYLGVDICFMMLVNVLLMGIWVDGWIYFDYYYMVVDILDKVVFDELN